MEALRAFFSFSFPFDGAIDFCLKGFLNFL